MTPHDYIWITTLSVTGFAAVFLAARYGWQRILYWERQQEAWYDRVLNHQLLLDVHPRVALIAAIAAMLLAGFLILVITDAWLFALIAAAVAYFLPNLVIRHLEQKRKQRLDAQLVDGITTLASGVRAGLNLIQAMELLVNNSTGPIKQEFTQLLREYTMGLDLNQAMRNASDRIGLSNYRLLFTAVEMHRLRGGNAGESMDRIAESIREIQRLEGKLDALTAQGRTQARYMGILALALVFIAYKVDPEGTQVLFSEPMGRIILLVAGLMMLAGYLWIRRIMAIDI